MISKICFIKNLENSQDAVQSFVDTLYKMDMLLDKKKTSKNPQTKNTKKTTTINPYQCSFLYNFCFIARWQKRKFGFYQLLFPKHRTQTFYNISTNKENKNLLIYKIAIKKRIRYVNMLYVIKSRIMDELSNFGKL